MLRRLKTWVTSWRKLPVMSGIEPDLAAARQAREGRLMALLDRQEPVDALKALVDALQYSPQQTPLETTAIALDANVFLRLGNHKNSADIADYISTKHQAPLVLPGQVIQEFWNNQLRAVETLSEKAKKSFDQFGVEVTEIDAEFGEFAEEFRELLGRFNGSFGYVFDKQLVKRTHSILEIIQNKADVPFVSRTAFAEIALHRKRTKTPPGFKDDGDGDFYVWADMLCGLHKAQIEGREFSKVAFISLEKKSDWMREGAAHPILVSEVQALLGVPFEIWNLDKLATAVAESA
jgi:hypothetical protein